MRARVIAAAILIAVEAHADEQDDRDMCFAASLEGQVLKKNNQLVRARARLAVCARPVCEQQKKCDEWLVSVEAALPTIVVDVVDDRGAPVLGVRSAVLDGASIPVRALVPVNPGPHAIHAEHVGRTASTDVTTASGEKEKKVRIVIDLSAEHRSRPVPWTVFGFGAVALASIGAAAALGTASIVQQNDLAWCNPSCAPGKRSPLEATTYGTDVAVGVAIASALTAAAIFAFRPTRIEKVRLGGAHVLVF